MSWRIVEVIRVGTITGYKAGDTTQIRVVFPWGEEVREFAPTIDAKGIKNTLDSIVQDRGTVKAAVTSKEILKLIPSHE